MSSSWEEFVAQSLPVRVKDEQQSLDGSLRTVVKEEPLAEPQPRYADLQFEMKGAPARGGSVAHSSQVGVKVEPPDPDDCTRTAFKLLPDAEPESSYAGLPFNVKAAPVRVEGVAHSSQVRVKVEPPGPDDGMRTVLKHLPDAEPQPSYAGLPFNVLGAPARSASAAHTSLVGVKDEPSGPDASRRTVAKQEPSQVSKKEKNLSNPSDSSRADFIQRPVCGLAFAKEGRVLHRDREPHTCFPCPHCGHCFTKKRRKHHFKRFYSTHRKLRDRRKTARRRVVRSQNQLDGGRNLRQKGPYPRCSKCGRGFTTPRRVKKHEILVHSEQKCFPCTVCAALFPTRGLLVSHVRKKHQGVNPYSCDDCKQTFRTLNMLSDHRVVAH